MDSFQGISFCWGWEIRKNRVAVPRGQGGRLEVRLAFENGSHENSEFHEWIINISPFFLNGHEVVVRFHHFPTYPFCIFFRWVLFNRNCWDTTISVQRISMETVETLKTYYQGFQNNMVMIGCFAGFCESKQNSSKFIKCFSVLHYPNDIPITSA